MMVRVRIWRRLFSGQGCVAVFMYVVLIVTAANYFMATFASQQKIPDVHVEKLSKEHPSDDYGASEAPVTSPTGIVYHSEKMRRRNVKSLPSGNQQNQNAPSGQHAVNQLPHNNNNNNHNNNINNNNSQPANPYRGAVSFNNQQLNQLKHQQQQKLEEAANGIRPDPLLSMNQNLPQHQNNHMQNQQQQQQQHLPNGQLQQQHQQQQPQQPQQQPPGPYIVPERIVHFDLKGAPPKPEYFVNLLRLIKQFGATGILVEWEDTFPYKGRFENATSLSGYTMNDVDLILNTAKDLNLSITPLVQTFGHLEWILKLKEFAHLRDSREFSTVMCVANDEAWALLKDMVDQVAAVHTKYGMPYVHIGADEIFQVGGCPESSQKMSELNRSKEKYMVWHIARMARHIKENYNGTNVLIWHDMIANMAPMDITQSGLNTLVEPVVWNYAEDIERYMSPMPFGVVWGASAFKGADGPMRYHANPNHYIRNSQSWLRQIQAQHHKFHPFKGVFLTGWSRYDHFAVLAEIFPVATPSLVMCLITLSTGKSQFAIETQRLLDCPMTQSNGPSGRCNYTGYNVFQQVQALRSLRQSLPSDIYSDIDPGFEFNGWLGRMNLAQAFSSSWYLNKLLPKVRNYHDRIVNIYKTLESELSTMFYEDTVAEWLYEYVGPELEKLGAVRRKADAIRAQSTFPRRPLPGIVPQLEYMKTLVNGD